MRDERQDKEGNERIDEEGLQRAGCREGVREKTVSQELWEVGKERNKGRYTERILLLFSFPCKVGSWSVRG